MWSVFDFAAEPDQIGTESAQGQVKSSGRQLLNYAQLVLRSGMVLPDRRGSKAPKTAGQSARRPPHPGEL
eukprot:1795945-Rhodomonas_salina.1